MIRGRGRVAVRLLALAVTFAWAGQARAQEVRLAERPRTEAQRALEAFLARPEYAIWTRDTVLARGDTVSGDLLVLEASVRIAGRVDGDIFVVDGDLFLRTRGSVGGDVFVLGGGFYDSDLAEIEGTITYRPNERVRVRPTDGHYEVIHEVEPLPGAELDGTWGFHIPVYQRVDALTLGWGALGRLVSWPGRPETEAVLRFKTGPSDLEATLRQSVYLSDRVRLGLLASRETRTNDAWIRPAWYNSLAHFVAGDDNRDYYRADLGIVELELISPEPPVWEDAPEWGLALSVGWEEATSLPARDVTVLFGESPFDECPECAALPTVGFRPEPNPAVDEGDLYFVRAGFAWSKRGRGGRTAFGLGLEAGFDDDLAGEVPGEDFDFVLLEGRVSARRVTPWGHAVDLFAIGRTDLSGVVPRQRYSTLGGVGTLPTRPLRSLRAPRMAYAELTYAVPVLGMASLGGLDVFARGSVGGVASDAGLASGGIDFDPMGAVMAGLAVRLWDFQMEAGVAGGAVADPDDPNLLVFFDVRVRRSARPSQMPARGRGF